MRLIIYRWCTWPHYPWGSQLHAASIGLKKTLQAWSELSSSQVWWVLPGCRGEIWHLWLHKSTDAEPMDDESLLYFKMWEDYHKSTWHNAVDSSHSGEGEKANAQDWSWIAVSSGTYGMKDLVLILFQLSENQMTDTIWQGACSGRKAG